MLLVRSESFPVILLNHKTVHFIGYLGTMIEAIMGYILLVVYDTTCD